MNRPAISRATLGRLPIYLKYLKTVDNENVSATTIAKALELGEVLVRKDLKVVCGQGKPKTGYQRKNLIFSLTKALGIQNTTPAVIVGAGKLGLALLDYDGFKEYGLDIIAAFDNDTTKIGLKQNQKSIYPIEQLKHFCQMQDIHIGILTVPKISAQNVCDMMLSSGISAIWNFSPCNLEVPENITVRNENLALSLAHLNISKIH